jgi:hypothetical protein
LKIYLLFNGVKVRLMAITGPNVAAEETASASATVRDFFSQGTREEIMEVTIRTDAAETIIRAIAAFDEEPVPLVAALSELLNFRRDLGHVGRSDWTVPDALQAPVTVGNTLQSS